MSHILVKITVDDDGVPIENPVWHLVATRQGNHALCTGEFFGGGESMCEFELREVERGIPCPNCAEIIKAHKAIKL